MRGSGWRMAPTNPALPTQDLEDIPAPQYPLIPPMTEYFFDGTNDVAIFPPPVTIEPVEVDFGACPKPKDPSPVPLCLMNHTNGKSTVAWTRRADCFQPPHPNGLYAVELEAFAVYKVCGSTRDRGRWVLCPGA